MPVDPWKTVDRFIDAVSLVTQEKHFKLSLQTLARSLGYEFYAYINNSFKSSFALSNYPKEWQDRYFQKSYQSVDPVIEIARRTMAPFTWSLEDRHFRRQQRRGFAREANEFGNMLGDDHRHSRRVRPHVLPHLRIQRPEPGVSGAVG